MHKDKKKMNTEKDCTALDQGDDNHSHMLTSQIGIAQTMEIVSSDKFTVTKLSPWLFFLLLRVMEVICK
jgi:hypothetical protein